MTTVKTPKLSKRPHLRYRLPIINSGREIILQVTGQDCKMGKRDSPEACALALAARHELRGLKRVQVMKRYAYFEFSTHVERFRVSQGTRTMIRKFDKGGMFEPGIYRFCAVPPSYLRPRTGTSGPKITKHSHKHGKYMRPRGNLKIGEIYASK